MKRATRTRRDILVQRCGNAAERLTELERAYLDFVQYLRLARPEVGGMRRIIVTFAILLLATAAFPDGKKCRSARAFVVILRVACPIAATEVRTRRPQINSTPSSVPLRGWRFLKNIVVISVPLSSNL